MGSSSCQRRIPLPLLLLLLLTSAAAGLAYGEGGFFDGLYEGYNISQYLVDSGRLDSNGQGRGFSKHPLRRTFSFGLLGIPKDTTVRFQLQVVTPFNEVLDALNADDFRSEWYLSIRYRVQDIQASVFRSLNGGEGENMDTMDMDMMGMDMMNMDMMNATAMMMMQGAAAAAGATQMGAAMGVMGEMGAQMGAQMGGMSAAEMQAMPAPSKTLQAPTTTQYGGSQQRIWPGHAYNGDHYWQNRIDRQGELDNEVGVARSADLIDAQKFRVDQKIKIYERLEQVYKRQGEDAPAQCVLRAICEVAEAPMDDGVLGDVVNLLLSATNGIEDLLHAKWLDKQYRPYLEAHMYGEMRGDCPKRYSKCTLNVLSPASLAFF